MIDTIRPDDDELIRKEIDGEITPAEREALERRMAEEPLVRARHDSLGKLVSDLARVGLVEPPDGFAAAILRAARGRHAAAPIGWTQTVRSAFARRPAFGYALSLAAGIVLGALAIGLVGVPRLDSSAAATALPGHRLEQAASLDLQRLDGAGVEGEAVTRRTEAGIVAEVRIASGGPVDLTIEFDPAAFSALAVERDGGRLADVKLESGQFLVSGAGSGTYRLVLVVMGTGTPPLRVRLDGSGARLEKSLRTAE